MRMLWILEFENTDPEYFSSEEAARAYKAKYEEWFFQEFGVEDIVLVSREWMDKEWK